MAPFHPQVVLFDVATKWVVFCGTVFTWWHVDGFAFGCVMVEVDPTAVAVLISLLPCSRSTTGTGSAAASSAPWCS